MKVGVVFAAALLGLTGLVGAMKLANVTMFDMGPSAPAAAASGFAPGTTAQFAYLAKQNSSTCGLDQSTVRSYADTARIQGSCCSDMDWGRYRGQVRDLRKYREIAQIPVDPYDIPAGLAKKLFGFEQSIKLTPAQQAVYKRAMHLAPEGAPCCCECWRWHAFAGLSKYLIVQKHFSAKQVANVVGLIDGCGGKA